FLFRGDELLVRDADHALPDDAACAELGLSDAPWQRLWPAGRPEQRTLQLGRGEPVPELAGYRFRKLRSCFATHDERFMALASRAFQIAEWARTHRYCGACGQPNERVPHEHCMR